MDPITPDPQPSNQTDQSQVDQSQVDQSQANLVLSDRHQAQSTPAQAESSSQPETLQPQPISGNLTQRAVVPNFSQSAEPNDYRDHLAPTNAPATTHQASADDRYWRELAQEILELKLVALSDAENYSREVERLRAQVSWLTSVLALVLTLIGGGLVWLTYSLRTDQSRLAQEVRALTDSAADIQRLTDLQNEVERLNQQVPRLESQLDRLNDRVPSDLKSDLETQSATLDDLQTKLGRLEGDFDRRRQAISVLARALQDLVSESDSSASPLGSADSNSDSSSGTSPASPQPSPSPPANEN